MIIAPGEKHESRKWLQQQVGAEPGLLRAALFPPVLAAGRLGCVTSRAEIRYGSKDVRRKIWMLSTEGSRKRGDGLVVDEDVDDRLTANDSCDLQGRH